MISSKRGALLTLFVSLASSSLFAQSDVHKFAQIDGVSRELLLQENNELLQALPSATDAARHYQGRLADFPDSWARLSLIDGQWQGVVVNDGNIFLINHLADSPQQSARSSEFAVSAISSFEDLGDCGLAHPPAQTGAAHQAQALTSQALVGQAATVNFPSYCSETVDGVCLVAELTVVFDDKFKQAFPNNYAAQAEALLNVVDGFYRQDFKIVFRRLNLDFTHGSNFTSSRDPFVLLPDIGDKRANNSLTSFDPNKRSLLHLVTGRDFRFDENGTVNDDVVGLAYSPDYAVGSYPSNFSPVLCDSSGSAVGTSQVLNNAQGNPDATRTALVVTHELGHNFGAEHDGTSDSITAASCTDPSKIMAPYVTNSFNGFSTCSQNTIATNISRLTSVEACFDFPVEASLEKDSGNITQTTPAATFTQEYVAELSTAHSVNGTVTVTGTLTGDSTFGAVTLGGSNCPRGTGNQTYTCTTTTLSGPSALAVTLNANSTHVILSQTITPSSASHLYDVDSDNNALLETIQVLGADLPPNSLTGAASGNQVQLAWQDHSTNEQGFVIERRQGSGDWTVIADGLAANTQSYTDAGLTPLNTYTYRVSALFDGERSTPSNEISVDVGINSSGSGSGSMRIGSGKGGGGGSLSPLLLILMGGMASRLALSRRRR
ncbi:MAG TPA: M12 family metallo-peptidase [Dongiaceae bacterium]|nr:M12 family metallo-peptidase [Dongiaceae bacterium]